jgi:hypothetical protein
VGTGLVTLRNSGRADPVVRVETLYQSIDEGLGAEVLAWFERQDWRREHDPLAGTYTTADRLVLHQEAERGGDGWQLATQQLTLEAGLRWSETVDQLLVEVVGRCDGSTPVEDLLAKLVADHELDLAEVRGRVGPEIGRLVERGMLRPVG